MQYEDSLLAVLKNFLCIEQSEGSLLGNNGYAGEFHAPTPDGVLHQGLDLQEAV